MLKEERYKKIHEIVEETGKITVGEIVEYFDVSDMTARRDLKELERSGLLRRVHGGAIYNLGRSYEPPYQLRESHGLDAKQAIGRAAAEMIFDGDSIVLDVGTTTMEIALSLNKKRNITILTASLPIAYEIASRFSIEQDIRLIIAGGIVRARELSMTGNIPQDTFRQFHVDKAFIGVGGLSLTDGLTEFNLEDALVKKPLLTHAQKKIVVTTGDKFGRTAFAGIGPLSAIDVIITDESAPKEIVASLEDMGIDVIIAT